MADLIAIIIILALIGGAAGHIIKQKKKGVRCIGCPDAGCCPHTQNNGNAGCCCGCSEKDNQ